MNAVYCVFLGAEGRAQVMDLCGVWLDESPDPWDRCWAGRSGVVVALVVVVGLGFSGTEGELVSDRRGSLSDKWRDSPWPEGAAGPARLPRTLAFTLRNVSWHHNCIITARPHLFIPRKWTERSVWTLADNRHLVGLHWLIGLLIRRVTTYSKIGYRPAWWMWCSVFDDSV